MSKIGTTKQMSKKEKDFWLSLTKENEISLSDSIKAEFNFDKENGWYKLLSSDGEALAVLHIFNNKIENLSGAPSTIILNPKKYMDDIIKETRGVYKPWFDVAYHFNVGNHLTVENYKNSDYENLMRNPYFIKKVLGFWGSRTDKDFERLDVREYKKLYTNIPKYADKLIKVYDGNNLLWIENTFNCKSQHPIEPTFITFDMEESKKWCKKLRFNEPKEHLEWNYEGIEDYNNPIDFIKAIIDSDFYDELENIKNVEDEKEKKDKKMSAKKTKNLSPGLSAEKKEKYLKFIKDNYDTLYVAYSAEDVKYFLECEPGGLILLSDEKTDEPIELISFNDGVIHNAHGMPARIIFPKNPMESPMFTEDYFEKYFSDQIYEMKNFDGEVYYLHGIIFSSKKDYDETKSKDMTFRLRSVLEEEDSLSVSNIVESKVSPATISKTTTSKFKEAVKSDLSEVATRVAVKKSTELLSKVVIDFLASNKKGAEANSMKKKVKDILQTKDGMAAFQLLIGALLPLLATNDKVPENIKDVISQVSKGFRTDGMTHFAVEFVDYLSGPGAQQVRESIVKAFEGFKQIDDLANGKGSLETQIRALTEPTPLFLINNKEEVKEEEEEDEVIDEVKATKAKLKQLKLSRNE